jgi:hypothetical protein
MLGPIFDPALQLISFIILKYMYINLNQELTLLLNACVCYMETLFLNAIAKDVFKVHVNGTWLEMPRYLTKP